MPEPLSLVWLLRGNPGPNTEKNDMPPSLQKIHTSCLSKVAAWLAKKGGGEECATSLLNHVRPYGLNMGKGDSPSKAPCLHLNHTI